MVEALRAAALAREQRKKEQEDENVDPEMKDESQQE